MLGSGAEDLLVVVQVDRVGVAGIGGEVDFEADIISAVTVVDGGVLDEHVGDVAAHEGRFARDEHCAGLTAAVVAVAVVVVVVRDVIAAPFEPAAAAAAAASEGDFAARSRRVGGELSSAAAVAGAAKKAAPPRRCGSVSLPPCSTNAKPMRTWTARSRRRGRALVHSEVWRRSGGGGGGRGGRGKGGRSTMSLRERAATAGHERIRRPVVQQCGEAPLVADPEAFENVANGQETRR